MANTSTTTQYQYKLTAGAAIQTVNQYPVTTISPGTFAQTIVDLLVLAVPTDFQPPAPTAEGGNNNGNNQDGPKSTSTVVTQTTIFETYAQQTSSPIFAPKTYTDGAGIVHVQTLPDGQYTAPTSSAQPSTTTIVGVTTNSDGSTTSFTSLATYAPSNEGPSSNDNSRDGGIGAGALAGGIVGGVVLGALVAFLAACLLFRRRRKGYRAGGAFTEEKPHVYPWDAYLPQSADDGTIRRQVESLYSQIDMHVENYYGAKPAAGVAVPEVLSKVDSSKLPTSLQSGLASATPTPFIKHTFAWVILSQLAPGNQGEPSLLPSEFARMPPQLAAPPQSKGSAREDQATPQAYKYWRVLTAHLMYPRSSKQNIHLNDIPSARECIDTLSTAFAPWSKTQDGAAREHLTSVVKSASETGLVLMSQPSAFAFNWDGIASVNDANKIATFPSLDKIADERGNSLPQGQVVVKPRTEAIKM